MLRRLRFAAYQSCKIADIKALVAFRFAKGRENCRGGHCQQLPNLTLIDACSFRERLFSLGLFAPENVTKNFLAIG